METKVNQENQLTVIESESALSLITKAEIDVQISTAKAFPRSLKMFLDRAMSMATISEQVAESCSYSLPRGGKSLEGPTVRLAEIVCSTYGNIRAGARVIANDGKTVTAQGICHDLETNYCVTVEVKRSILQNEYKKDENGKNVRTGKLIPMNEDMQVVTGNAACAVAYRNAVFKVVPSALVSDIYDKSRQVARGTEETLPARRKKALDYLHSLNVTDKQICDILEIKKVEDIDLDKLDTLRGMCTLIKNGESTVKSLFEPNKESSTAIALEDIEILFEMKKDGLSVDQRKDAERIIKNKETASYNKLFKILQEL
jgi:hypothetical protein